MSRSNKPPLVTQRGALGGYKGICMYWRYDPYVKL